MDYLRKVLILVRKYHFWALAALVLVLLGVFWTSAAARFSESYQKRESDIQQDFKNMYELAGLSDPVNEMVYTALKNVHEQLRNNVMRGWRYLYKQQQENNRLPDVLGERFKKEWEKREEHGWNEELPPDLREHYWNFIERHFPNLLKDAKIRRPTPQEQLLSRAGGPPGPELSEAGAGMSGIPQDGEEGIVIWEEANYRQMEAAFRWNQLPTTQQIRLAQEDLWVYETLLGIVKELNKGATSHYNAVVKRIFALDIGRYATNAFFEARDALGLRVLSGVGMGGGGVAGGMPGELSPPQPGAPPGDAGPAMFDGPPPGDAMPPGAPPGMLEGPGLYPGFPVAGATALDQPYAYRYVDQNEQPVLVENGVPKHPFSEFKMMPIRMRLLMDQRRIPELLVLCANSKMPIEVRQVRINPGRAAKVNYAAGRSSLSTAMAPRFGPMGEGVGPMAPGGPGAGQGSSGLEGLWTPPISVHVGAGLGMGASGPGDTFYQGHYDLVVEVLGIIYIYEPPDESKLGTGTALSPSSAAQGPAPEAPGPLPEAPGEQQPTTPATPALPTGPGTPAEVGPTGDVPVTAPPTSPAPPGDPAAGPPAPSGKPSAGPAAISGSPAPGATPPSPAPATPGPTAPPYQPKPTEADLPPEEVLPSATPKPPTTPTGRST